MIKYMRIKKLFLGGASGKFVYQVDRVRCISQNLRVTGYI